MQAGYRGKFFMLVAFLWLCWKVREMRVRPKYLAKREIIKRIAKDIACGKENDGCHCRRERVLRIQ